MLRKIYEAVLLVANNEMKRKAHPFLSNQER